MWHESYDGGRHNTVTDTDLDSRQLIDVRQPIFLQDSILGEDKYTPDALYQHLLYRDIPLESVTTVVRC